MCTNHLIKAFMKPADDINCTNGSSRLLPFLLVQAIAHREEGKKFSRAENALETLFPSSPPSPSALLFDTFLPECLSHSLLQVVQRVDLREREYGTPSIYRSRRSIPIADLQREMPLQPLQCRRSAATWTTCNATVSQNHFRPTPLGPPATPPSAKTISGLLQLDLLQRHNQPKPFLAYSTWTSCNGNATRPICQFRPPSTPTTLILYTMGLVYLALFSESGANCLKEKEKIVIFARMCRESGPRLSCTTTEKESNSYEKSVSYQYAFA